MRMAKFGSERGRTQRKARRVPWYFPQTGRFRQERGDHAVGALDADLPGLKQPTKAALEHAMTGHMLATATLIGIYEKRTR
jgi:hypothetical protein